MYRYPYQAFPAVPFHYPQPNMHMRQQPTEQEIMQVLRTQHNNLYSQLEQAGMARGIVDYVFSLVVGFTLNQANTNQSADQIYRQFQQQIPWLNLLFRRFNVPQNLADRVLVRVIQITLNQLDNGGGEQPGDGWSGWENLGGTLTSAPTVASWQRNRLDVFARGTDQSLFHKYWNGRQWSNWSSLGGNLTSAPAAVSWGPNRIDVFARGQNQDLIHRWWNGSSWSNWESLGGTLTSGPAVSSTQRNRLEVFVRGNNRNLYLKTWNGSSWSNWQNLRGKLFSKPAAVSWGENRIDVFARGQNQNLIHLYPG